MFLLRTIFWLSVVVLLLPTDDANKTTPERVSTPPAVSAVEAIKAARYTAHDLTGFCDRNPNVCRTGGKAFDLFKEKARHGARMLYDWAADDGGQPATADPDGLDHSAAVRGREPAGSIRLGDASLVTGSTGAGDNSGTVSQDTLTREDLIPVWGGPATRTPA